MIYNFFKYLIWYIKYPKLFPNFFFSNNKQSYNKKLCEVRGVFDKFNLISVLDMSSHRNCLR